MDKKIVYVIEQHEETERGLGSDSYTTAVAVATTRRAAETEIKALPKSGRSR